MRIVHLERLGSRCLLGTNRRIILILRRSINRKCCGVPNKKYKLFHVSRRAKSVDKLLLRSLGRRIPAACSATATRLALSSIFSVLASVHGGWELLGVEASMGATRASPQRVPKKYLDSEASKTITSCQRDLTSVN